jgi:Tripartite tricarboxylate transporter TctB family
VSAAVAVLGVWVLEQSTTFDLGTPAGPWLMPALAGALLVVLGVVGAVSPERRIAEPWTLAVLVRLGLVAATLIAFLVTLSTEGFLLAAILLSFAFAAIARGTLRLRSAVVLTGLATAVVLYCLFAFVFKVPLPGPVWLGGNG